MISKSYVVFTTIVAVLLFGADLSPRTGLAIACIVVAGSLLSVNPREQHATREHHWLLLAFVAFFGWGLLSLTAKYLFGHGVEPVAFLTGISTTAFVCIMIENASRRSIMAYIPKYWGLFVLIGAAAASFNYFNFTAISLAPNVGYVNATNAASIGAVTAFSIILFRDELSWRKLAGVMGVIAGLVMLLI